MTPSGNPLNLRPPWDRSVADCMWLARFIDKARLQATGRLTADFEPFFGHRLATDGTFLAHFGFTLEEAMSALRNGSSDTEMGTWFLERPGVTAERITAWNTLGPKLGRPGQVMERAFRFAQRKYYGGALADPRVVSVFSGIAWDEGCLNDCPSADD